MFEVELFYVLYIGSYIMLFDFYINLYDYILFI